MDSKKEKVEELLKLAVLAILESEEIEISKPFVIAHPINMYWNVLNILATSIEINISKDYQRFKPVFFSIIKEFGASFLNERKTRKFFLGSLDALRKQKTKKSEYITPQIINGARRAEQRHRQILGDDY